MTEKYETEIILWSLPITKNQSLLFYVALFTKTVNDKLHNAAI